MIYLSQILNKNVYYGGQKYGTLSDVAVFADQSPSLSKIIIKKGRKKLSVSPNDTKITKEGLFLETKKINFLPYDENEFYLNEDILDKQVIDINGKRLVRVNDILLEANGEIKIVGIDIGSAGIIRRLHLDSLIKFQSKILPWKMIEAFDYQTGDIKIKVTQSKLNTFHPSELADLLEDVGTKERLGIVGTLEAGKAAQAIEEAEDKTQEAILEQLPPSFLNKIVNKMRPSEIADVFYKLDPLRIRQILKLLGREKAEKVQRLIQYSGDTAGGLMDVHFFIIRGSETLREALRELTKEKINPEAIMVINDSGKFQGILYLKDLINVSAEIKIKDLPLEKRHVLVSEDFEDIFEMFTEYNLRILPVLAKDRRPIGVITIDSVLARIEEETEEEDEVIYEPI